jgi:hypothetical protein
VTLDELQKLCDEALSTIQPETHWRWMALLLAVARAAQAGPCRHHHDQHVCDLCKAIAALET